MSDEACGKNVENESMVNLSNWLDLRFVIEAGD
jgi:hypothetical protein